MAAIRNSTEKPSVATKTAAPVLSALSGVIVSTVSASTAAGSTPKASALCWIATPAPPPRVATLRNAHAGCDQHLPAVGPPVQGGGGAIVEDRVAELGLADADLLDVLTGGCGRRDHAGGVGVVGEVWRMVNVPP